MAMMVTGNGWVLSGTTLASLDNVTTTFVGGIGVCPVMECDQSMWARINVG
jgi:hypothetical protein